MRSGITTQSSAAVGGSAGTSSLLYDRPASRLIRRRTARKTQCWPTGIAVPQWPAPAAMGVQRGSQMTSGMSRSVRRW